MLKKSISLLAVLIPFTLLFASCGSKKAANQYNKFQKQVNKLEGRASVITKASALVAKYKPAKKDEFVKKLSKHLKEMQSIVDSMKAIKAPNDEIKKMKDIKVNQYKEALKMLKAYNKYFKDPKGYSILKLSKDTKKIGKNVKSLSKEYMSLRSKYIEKHNLREK